MKVRKRIRELVSPDKSVRYRSMNSLWCNHVTLGRGSVTLPASCSHAARKKCCFCAPRSCQQPKLVAAPLFLEEAVKHEYFRTMRLSHHPRAREAGREAEINCLGFTKLGGGVGGSAGLGKLWEKSKSSRRDIEGTLQLDHVMVGHCWVPCFPTVDRQWLRNGR